MFIDEKSPRGLLFIAEQNLLSRTSVKTQAGGAGYGGAKSHIVIRLAEINLTAAIGVGKKNISSIAYLKNN